MGIRMSIKSNRACSTDKQFLLRKLQGPVVSRPERQTSLPQALKYKASIQEQSLLLGHQPWGHHDKEKVLSQASPPPTPPAPRNEREMGWGDAVGDRGKGKWVHWILLSQRQSQVPLRLLLLLTNPPGAVPQSSSMDFEQVTAAARRDRALSPGAMRRALWAAGVRVPCQQQAGLLLTAFRVNTEK